MKTTKYFLFTLLKYGRRAFVFSLFTFSVALAQVEETPKVDEKAEINNLNSIQAIGEMVKIKDGTKIIVEFVSQGSSGLIRLPSLGTLVSFPGDNLYNSGGNLYWGGLQLGTSSSAAGWSYSGTKIYNTTITDKVGIGTTNPLSSLSVGGLGTSSATISGESTSGWAIFGKTTTGRGLYGSASGAGGRAVFGSANGTGGEGVIAEAHGENGKAISGYASGTNGLAGSFVGDVNVSGETTIETNGTNDVGIKANTIGTNGISVYGSASGSNSKAIYGYAPINVSAYAGWFIGNVWISGDLTVQGFFTNTSDMRFKKNISPLTNVINSLSQIEGLTYNWNTEEFPERNFNDKLQVGVIAQDLEKVFPNLVSTDKDGYKSVDYIKLSVITMQAVKEQQEIIEKQETSIKIQDMRIKELEDKLSKIESLLEEKRFTSVSE